MLDALDSGLVHALHLDARAPFGRIASALGTSPQTVQRRYRRLRDEAGLRVVGLADPHRSRRQRWIVRLSVTPRVAQDVAAALARRTDTSWVRLTSGGTEIVTVVHTATELADPHALLLRDVPRTAGITGVSAHYMLHTYLGGPTAWRGHLGALTDDQRAHLRTWEEVTEEPGPITEADRSLLAVLARDGRATYAALAVATGWSADTAARRVDDLRRRGILYFDVELNDALLGITTSALLWMSVPPAHLDAVARRLAGHPELAVVAATTGRTNLLATVLAADPSALHAYLIGPLAMPEIAAIETAPILRTVKGIAPA